MKKIIGLLLLLSITAGVNASECLEKKEGQSEDAIAIGDEVNEEASKFSEAMELFMCAVEMPKSMSPTEIFGEKCEDGSIPCAEVIKKACKINKWGVWNNPVCPPFAPLLLM